MSLDRKFLEAQILYEKKIADLEAKLAEKDAERELDNSFWKQECDSLQKALAEKEQEIENLRSWWTYEKDQDKISFAVEQLDKFRDTMEKLNENNSGYIIRFSSMRDREKFHEAIDNQIKQLKEGK